MTARPAIADIGRAAAAVLAEGSSGRIAAVFERSFYLEAGGSFACVGSDIGQGPLNAKVNPVGWVERSDDPTKRNIELGTEFAVRNGTLLIAGSGVLSLREARLWLPPRPARLDRDDCAAALDTLIGATMARTPADGLARMTFASVGWVKRSADPMNTTDACWVIPRIAVRGRPNLRPALSSIAALSRGIDGPAAEAAAVALLGLGPGLTPSGDDVVGGMLIALAAAGLTDQRDALWAAVEPFLAARTSPLSAAHLRAAADGEGAAAVHALLNDLLAGATGSLARRLDDLDGIGHTSGWDAAAGLVLALGNISR